MLCYHGISDFRYESVTSLRHLRCLHLGGDTPADPMTLRHLRYLHALMKVTQREVLDPVALHHLFCVYSAGSWKSLIAK